MLTITEILKASGVEQETKARYFKPEYRTCEHTARFVVAVETAIESANKERDDSERKLNNRIVSDADKINKLSATITELKRKLNEARMAGIKMGMDTLDLPEVTIKRIMSPSLAS